MDRPLFTLLPGHELAYNEIVKPSRRWSFSYYYLHRWLPLLHPQQALLIQVLRQATWRNGRPTGECQLSNGVLCRMMGWSESSHKTLLAEVERPHSDWFLRRERSRKRHVLQGHPVEGAPRYRITMDEPLTPRDQHALESHLRTHHPATAYQAAEILGALADRRSRELWEMLDELPPPATPPPAPRTVLQLCSAAWPHLAPLPPAARRTLADAAQRCQLRLTGAGYAHQELDYLLRGWIGPLGAANSLLVVALRARCFHDPQSGESRDRVTLGRGPLSAQLGIPKRTFRRLLRDEGTLPFFHISPPGEEPTVEMPRQIPHRGDLCFHVAFPLLPVAPADQPRYERLLLGSIPLELSTGGQPSRLEPASQPGSPPGLLHRRPADPARTGQSTRLNGSEAASQPGSNRPADPAVDGESGQPTRLEPASQPTILVTRNDKELSSKKEESSNQSLGKGGEEEELGRIRALLEPFGMEGVERVLEEPGLRASEVRGWILRGREEVEPAQMAGYLFRRLVSPGRSRWHLPEAFRLTGELTGAEEQLFERWWVEEQSPPPFESPAQRARYGAWLRVTRHEIGDPDRPDFSPRARWRRELARSAAGLDQAPAAPVATGAVKAQRPPE